MYYLQVDKSVRHFKLSDVPPSSGICILFFLYLPKKYLVKCSKFLIQNGTASLYNDHHHCFYIFLFHIILLTSYSYKHNRGD